MKEQGNKTILSTDTEIDLEKVGDKIAGGTLPDLNAHSIEDAMSMIKGTALNMGTTVES